MERILESVLGKKDDESDAQSASSAGDCDPSRAVTFEVESSASVAGEQHMENNNDAGGMMDSMAYLTQPDPTCDNSENDEEVQKVEEQKPKEETPQKQISRPNTKKGGRGRARSQSGDHLSRLQQQSTPEGRRISSLSARNNNCTPNSNIHNMRGKPIQSPALSALGSPLPPLHTPSPLMMSRLNPSSRSSTKSIRSIPSIIRSSTSTRSVFSSKTKHGKMRKGVNNLSKTAFKSPEKATSSTTTLLAKDSADAILDSETKTTNNATNGDNPDVVKSVDFGITEPIMEEDEVVIEIDEEQLQKQRLLHQMEMKKRAIYRSLLHLSDNSYSFVYDDPNDGNQTNVAGAGAINNDEEPGLPFIGPGAKTQYDDLRFLLKKGLLGYADDDDVGDNLNEKPSKVKSEDDGKNDKVNTVGDKSKGGKSEHDGQTCANNGSNPFLPRIDSNVAAVLMGPRGHGKSLVLERCLVSLSRLAGKRKERALEQIMNVDQSKKAEELYSQASFRVVRLNGLLFQGDSAVACTREIARQIGVMSREERKRTKKMRRQMGIKRKRLVLQPSDMETPKASGRKRKKVKSGEKSGQKKLMMNSPITPVMANQNDESHNLRARKSGFNTYIALLDEVLRTARVDGIPILIVLEELDAFLARGSASMHNVMDSSDGNLQQDGGSTDRQLLLYHLLDRVADHKFLVSVVGMTTDLTTVTKLEKRVQSRAEGTSKVIYFEHCRGYNAFAKSLLGKFYTPPDIGESKEDEYNERNAMLEIRKEVEVILNGGKSDDNGVNHQEEDGKINDFALVQRVLQRNYELIGSDMRWLCRVFDVALGLLASDIDEHTYKCMEDAEGHPKNDGKCDSIPRLSPSHVAQALVSMSASMEDVSGTVGRPGIPTQSTLELVRWGQLLGDPKHYSCRLGTHPRLAALLDLSGPQVAVLLAARRIAARDDTRDGEDEIEVMRTRGAVGGTSASMPLPLSYQRIRDEYTTSFVASGRYTISSDRYPPHVLYRSCMDLMEMDIIRLRKELCFGGALHYGHNDALSSGTNISNLPLLVNLEWELEFNGALKAGLLQCSTALREWGLKMN